MALYWPDQKVALDIIDDPYRHPFEGDESYTVLRVTCEELCNFNSYQGIMERLCELLGKEMPTMPGWEQKSRELHELLYSETMADLEECAYDPFAPEDDDEYEDDWGSLSNVEILASSKEEADRMRTAARESGQYVRGVSVWDGPIPRGSFEMVSKNTRMSTAEYFFFRKANQLPLPKAVALGIELCGKYRTQLTQYDRGEGYDFLKSPRTSQETIRRYLRDVRGTKEYKRARKVLRHVRDNCSSPMGCYLYLLLCLPTCHGSYGIERAMFSGVFNTKDGFMPTAHGNYLAYDLCWPDKHVALQYTGTKEPSKRDYQALTATNMSVICVTDDDIRNPDRFDAIAHELAALLEAELPEPTDKWLAARAKLRRVVPMPTFDHMRLIMDDLSQHKDW